MGPGKSQRWLMEQETRAAPEQRLQPPDTSSHPRNHKCGLTQIARIDPNAPQSSPHRVPDGPDRVGRPGLSPRHIRNARQLGDAAASSICRGAGAGGGGCRWSRGRRGGRRSGDVGVILGLLMGPQPAIPRSMGPSTPPPAATPRDAAPRRRAAALFNKTRKATRQSGLIHAGSRSLVRIGPE